ncbi:hypothetical protein ACIPSA_48480 [Streptomyces sp. NPDC086549]|uniref:hypothetical protein n=1 Tax=Streptomyces sp. NPDC086549 TaxID=3365752 RepID=UPI00382832C9
MGRKSPYLEEFWKVAVAVYRAAGGERMFAVVAGDLGVTAELLGTWVCKGESLAVPGDCDVGGGAAEELVRLRAGNVRLLKVEREWQLECGLLRGAAVCFAREVK